MIIAMFINLDETDEINVDVDHETGLSADAIKTINDFFQDEFGVSPVTIHKVG